MAGKKSNAQIKRLMKRAAARGETYVPPEKPATETIENNTDQPTQDSKAALSHEEVKAEAAKALEKDLENIQKDEGLKSKERRSAKRKAEAIAMEASGCASAAELLEWYKKYKNSKSSNDKASKDAKEKKHQNPYIVFIGQLSYETTKQTLFDHFQKELGAEHTISRDSLNIRLLTDPKTKKSRGMAFVECSDPELLYSCLKLHHTYLDGRRINVERSAGGKSNSEARKSKIQKFRDEQKEYFDSVVDTMFQEHYDNGSIQKGELDDGVVELCKRHSAAVVQAAMEEYVEKQGRDMDNPSAYLTFLLSKMAQEGIHEKDENGKKDKTKSFKSRLSSNNNKAKEPPSKKQKKSNPSMADKGVDMSISDPSGGDSNDMSSIFPSYNRGRGRGR